MASVIKVTSEDKRLARLDGFRRKAPKKVKQNASNDSMLRYIERYNTWAKYCKLRAAMGRKRDALKKQIRDAHR